ncbi:MAG: glycosyltransferase, partial [Coriobacteriales bacterium]|nr:glycosyltransferase [Coriobacteriales bacterium]
MQNNSKSEPAITVLVPIYNVEKYLRQCLNSLLAQTFTDFEVICINDGSTDGSSAIANEFAQSDSRFRCIHKTNSGYGASMNM